MLSAGLRGFEGGKVRVSVPYKAIDARRTAEMLGLCRLHLRCSFGLLEALGHCGEAIAFGEPPPAHRPEFPVGVPGRGHGCHGLGGPEIREGGPQFGSLLTGLCVQRLWMLKPVVWEHGSRRARFASPDPICVRLWAMSVREVSIPFLNALFPFWPRRYLATLCQDQHAVGESYDFKYLVDNWLHSNS
jgi:hypothetical protein